MGDSHKGFGNTAVMERLRGTALGFGNYQKKVTQMCGQEVEAGKTKVSSVDLLCSRSHSSLGTAMGRFRALPEIEADMGMGMGMLLEREAIKDNRGE